MRQAAPQLHGGVRPLQAPQATARLVAALVVLPLAVAPLLKAPLLLVAPRTAALVAPPLVLV